MNTRPIVLYECNETDFTHNGICILKDCISVKATENLCGTFTLELEYPVGEFASNEIVRGRIIKCKLKDNRDAQLFRIRNVVKDDDSLTANCQHIAIADLGSNIVPSLSIVGKTRTEAGQMILDNAYQTHRYTFVGEDSGFQSTLNVKRVSPINAIVGESEDEDNQVLLKTYGGEIRFNNFEIECYDEIGDDNGVRISYGKNLTGIEEKIDDTDLVTSIIPVGGDELLLPEYCINSQYINNYEKIYFQKIEFNDIKIVEPNENGDNADEVVTRDEALKQLRKAAQSIFDDQKADLPRCSYTINFVELSQFDYYSDYAQLEEVNIGDTVTINHSKLNISLKARVNSITYDVLDNSLEEITVGSEEYSLTTIINQTNRNIEFTKQKVLLEVSNLDKTLSSKIEMTEESIMAEVNNVNKGLNSKIEQTASQIRTEVSNTKKELQTSISQTASDIRLEATNMKSELQSSINVNAKAIEQRVTNSEFSTYKKQTAKDISQKVSKGSQFSSEMKQNVDAFQFLFEEASGSKTTIDRSGITVTNGGFKIENKKGQTVLECDSSGNLRLNHVYASDLSLDENSSKIASSFWNVLWNMETVTLHNLKISDGSRFTCAERDFYIDGFKGIDKYVEHIIYQYNVKKGWE